MSCQHIQTCAHLSVADLARMSASPNTIPTTFSYHWVIHWHCNKTAVSLITSPYCSTLPPLLLQLSWNQEHPERCQISPSYLNSSLLLQKIQRSCRHHLHIPLFQAELLAAKHRDAMLSRQGHFDVKPEKPAVSPSGTDEFQTNAGRKRYFC